MKKTPPLLILDFVTLLCLPYPGLAVSPIDGYAKWGLDFGAESLVPSHLPDYDINRYGDGILVTTHADPVTIAHELLYLLLNAGHHDYEAEYSNKVMLWSATEVQCNIGDPKRISEVQCKAAILSKLLH